MPHPGGTLMPATAVSAVATDERALTPPRLISREGLEPHPEVPAGETSMTEVDEPVSTGRGAEKPRGDTWLQWAGSVLTAVGVLLALFAAFLFLFTPLQASRAQHR